MGKLKVLFVDDEVKILNGIKRSLYGLNLKWDLSFAQGGKEALELLNQQPYDVIVTDMMMPEMRGEELLSIVIQNFPSVARIILSGQCNQATAFRLVGSEHLFLSKPCPTDLLIATIENAVLVSQAHVIPAQETDIEIDAHGVKDALCEFVKLLLMKGVIQLDTVPPNITSWLPQTTLMAFAPIVGNYDDFVKIAEKEEKKDSWANYFDTPFTS